MYLIPDICAVIPNKPKFDMDVPYEEWFLWVSSSRVHRDKWIYNISCKGGTLMLVIDQGIRKGGLYYRSNNRKGFDPLYIFDIPSIELEEMKVYSMNILRNWLEGIKDSLLPMD